MKNIVFALFSFVPTAWSVSALAQAPAPATTTIRLQDAGAAEAVPYVIHLTVSESASDSPLVGATVMDVPIRSELPNPSTGDAESRNDAPRDAALPSPSAEVAAPRDDDLHDRLMATRSAARSAPHADNAQAMKPPAGAKLISAPKITVLPSETATIEISSLQTFTYLESAEAGRYAAKRSEPKKLGMNIKLKADPSAEDESTVLCRLECEVSALVGREPVKGLDLDVGKPIVSTWSLKTTSATKLGALSQVYLPSGPNRTCLLTIEVTKSHPLPDDAKVLPNPPKEK
jgi:hypothetical protein